MTVKYDNKTAVTFLNFYMEHGSMSKAADACGASRAIGTVWARASLIEEQRGVEVPRYVVWGFPDPDEDKEPVRFYKALAEAKKIHAFEAESRARAEVDQGHERKLWKPDGSPVWRVDAEAIALLGGDGPDQKKAAEELLGYKDFPYVHRINKNGNMERIQETERVPVAATLKIAGMKAMMPQIWNVPEVKHSTVDASVRGAIQHISAKAKPQPSRALPPPGNPYISRDPNHPMRRDADAKLAEMRARQANGETPTAAPRPTVFKPDDNGDPPEGIGDLHAMLRIA